MKDDPSSMPFDHYQRYATAASLVRALGERARTVLEVGANRQRLLGEFLPGHRLLYSDIEPQQASDDFVVADASALPFPNAAHDAVVSLDVLEHIPPDLRVPAIGEMARVAARAVVVGCPIDRPWVHGAEQAAHSVWRRFFKEPYPWLEEHEEYGLVEPSAVEEALRSAGFRIVRFGQGDSDLWAALMGAHFIKEAVPELSGMVAALDSYYNSRLFEGDRSEVAYREFFVGLRHAEDLASVRRAAVLVKPCDVAGRELLSALSQRLLPVADRVREAELQWRLTADSLAATEARLQEIALAHHHTGVRLREEEERAVEQLHRADDADKRNVELREILRFTEERLQQEALARHQTGLELQEAMASGVEQLRRADAADQKYVALQARYDELHGRHEDVQARYEDVQARYEDLEVRVAGLLLQIAGWERRQRWAIRGMAAAAGIIALAMYAFLH